MLNTELLKVSSANSQRLAEAYKQLHSVIQWLARVECSYIQASNVEKPTLLWDDNGSIATQELSTNLRLELRLPHLVMHFTENGETSHHELELEEHSPAHVEAWILIELLHRGIDRTKFSKALPYDVSNLMAGDGVEFSPSEHQSELTELSSWFRNAASIIRSAVGRSNGEKETIRLCPQDMSIEAPAFSLDGTEWPGHGLVFGFAPGDAGAQEPFYYIARYVNGERGIFEAILKASEIPQDQTKDTIMRFFAEAAGRGEYIN